MEIPAARVTKVEKLRERRADRILKDAEKISQKLAEFKELTSEYCAEVFEAVMAENQVEATDRKGNFTWYNFDRSIKIEVAISDRIDFDDTLIAAAKEKFDGFLQSSTTQVDEMVRALIMEAFSTNKGRLDVKRVLNLVRYRTRVPMNKYPSFHEAVDLIEKAIRKPASKTYFRIWKKDSNGEYQAVELNFSKV